MPSFGRWRALAAIAAAAISSSNAVAQAISALPDQTSRIRLSNRDVNHVVCVGGDIGDVKFSAEKGVAVERGGSDAWIKFLVVETDDMGTKTRTYVTSPTEFFVSCNDSIYPLYAEPGDLPAQTVTLLPGAPQRARANDALLAPLVEEERAVSVVLSLLQDRVPASFMDVAPARKSLVVAGLPGGTATERRRIEIEGAGLSASEYLVEAAQPVSLEEQVFLDPVFGPDIFAVTLDRLVLSQGETARLVIVRRSAGR